MRSLLVFAVAATAMFSRVQAAALPEHQMSGPYDFDYDGHRVTTFFQLDDTRYTNIASLEAAVAKLPSGSELLWSGGCQEDPVLVELGRRPYITTADFRRFCSAHRIRFSIYFGR